MIFKPREKEQHPASEYGLRGLYVLAILLILSSPSCSDKDCAGPIPEWCHTVDLSSDYVPVCGCDGQTYINKAHAECAGISDYAEGPCR